MVEYEDSKDEILRQIKTHPVLERYNIIEDYKSERFHRISLRNYQENIFYILYFSYKEWFMNMKIVDPNQSIQNRYIEFSSCYCNSTKGSVCEMYEDLQDKLQDAIDRRKQNVQYLELILKGEL